ncbi:MAG: hypothetical protein H7A37_08970 [Chlamydiales bacterium]|nr:hypothetical protein [Chlamydiia bacterium]MCP5508411.1 hypothetical protein [Chlamydiales bacterium]
MSRALLAAIVVIACIGGLFLISNMADFKLLSGSSAGDPADVANWTEYEDVDEMFKVNLPSPPEHVSQTITDRVTNQIRHYSIYASKDLEGTVYMVTEITFPSEIDPTDNEDLLHDVVKEMVASKPTNELVSMESTTFHGGPAVNFQINGNEDTVIYGVTFSKNKKLYTVSSIGATKYNDEAKFEKFADSFFAKNDNIKK